MGKKTDILNDFFAGEEGQKLLKLDKKAVQALKKGKAPRPAAAPLQGENKKKGKKSKKNRRSETVPAEQQGGKAAAAKAPKGKARRSFDLSSAGDLVLDGNIGALQETRVAPAPAPGLNLDPDAGEEPPRPPAEPPAKSAQTSAQAAPLALDSDRKNPAPLKPAPEASQRIAPPPPVGSKEAPPQNAGSPENPPLEPLSGKPPALRKSAASKTLSPHLQMSRLRAGAAGGAGGGASGEEGSPFQLNLIQSESLRLAQNKIADLEEELENQRRDNEKLSSGAVLLEESLERLQAESEELRRDKEAAAADSANEKEVLLNAAEEGKKRIAKLEKVKKNLERRLSGDLQGVRARESALESKIEIMKIENSVVQKEKDKMIIEMKKEAVKMKENLSAAQTEARELKNRLGRVNENLRRTVSVLRATVNNLEGCRKGEDEEEEKEEGLKSA